MLALGGFLTLIALAVVISKKLCPAYVAAAFAPIILVMLLGFPVTEIKAAMVSGIVSSLPNMALLLFSVFFFSIIINTGFFDILIKKIQPWLTKNPFLLMSGTALITILIASTGLTIGAYMVVAAAMLPLFRRMRISSAVLGLLISTASNIGRIFPWTSRTLLLSTVTGISPDDLWQASGGIILFSMLGCLLLIFCCTLWHKRNKQLPANENDPVAGEADHRAAKAENDGAPFWVNALLCILCFAAIFTVSIPTYVLFFLFTLFAIILNCRTQKAQKRAFQYAAVLAFPVCIMQLSVGVMEGVFRVCGITDAMMQTIANILPVSLYAWFPVLLSALTVVLLYSLPFQCLFAILPIVVGIGTQAGVPAAIAAVPFAILFPLGYAPIRTVNTAIDDLLEQPKGTHLRFSIIPLALMQLFMLGFSVAFGYL